MQLTNEEVRILGCLIEKKLTTPEYYPLTVNKLMYACNQKNNRFPLTDYTEELIEIALEKMRDKGLVTRVTGHGIKTPKYRENFSEVYNFSEAKQAIIAELFLRGIQTPGELNSRASRMCQFSGLGEVNQILDELINLETGAAVVKLPKLGSAERFFHTFSDLPPSNQTEKSETVIDNSVTSQLLSEIKTLREEVQLLKGEIDEIKIFIEQFK
ncbi:MAG: DUF480 domain-containing protein [Ignavibacteriaceae bacterium]|nr:DUF480 domain-containing protein [Ignavibacteriaceae bacterium]